MQESNSKKDNKTVKASLATRVKNRIAKNPKAEPKSEKAKKEKKPGLKMPLLSKFKPKASHIVIAVFAVVFLAFFARVAIWEHNYLAAMEGSERDTATNSDGEVYEGGEEVDTTPPTPTEVTEYVVAPDMPRYLSIPRLGIYNARIFQVGLKSNNEMDTPRNAYDIGWYNQSSLPGTNGTAMINAHGGNLGNGIFRNLPNIQQGAEIRIEMGDGRLYTYRVVDTATLPLGDEANAYMNTAFVSPEPGKGSITLITCTGDWWLSSQTYSHRFFARAVLE